MGNAALGLRKDKKTSHKKPAAARYPQGSTLQNTETIPNHDFTLQPQLGHTQLSGFYKPCVAPLLNSIFMYHMILTGGRREGVVLIYYKVKIHVPR